MKLKNKKTGEITEFKRIELYEGYGIKLTTESLAELNEEWEDYEEPKRDYYYIDYNGTIKCFQYLDFDWQEEMKQIGNYFETEEEAEKAVEKLKAWKRLKDKGFRFDGYDEDFEGLWVIYPNDTKGTWSLSEDKADLDLLFGGEK